MKKTSLLFLLIVSLSFVCFGGWILYSKYYTPLPYYSKGAFAETKKKLTENGITPIASFAFPNHHGGITDNKSIASKVVVMNYFFTRCGSICPKMTNHLTQVQKEFQNDENVKLISFSCDPEYDSPEKLKVYADLYHVNANQWSLLTGEKSVLYQFARNSLQLSATEAEKSVGGKDDFIHSSYCVLIDKDQYIRGYYDATDLGSIKQLILDIKKLL